MRHQLSFILRRSYAPFLALLILFAIAFGCTRFNYGTERDNGEAIEEKGLVGTWKNEKTTLRFNADGTMLINNVNYRYKATDDVITMTGSDGSAEIPYRIKGNTLTVSYNGQEATYTRVKKSGGGRTSGKSGIRQELVGKWCYLSNVNTNDGGRMSSRCITFNGDGTYEYYAETTSSGDSGSTASQENDSGTWTATEDSITADSQSQGTRTYSYEKQNHPKTGDPMIVIDGDAYVTYNRRDPW